MKVKYVLIKSTFYRQNNVLLPDFYFEFNISNKDNLTEKLTGFFKDEITLKIIHISYIVVHSTEIT